MIQPVRRQVAVRVLKSARIAPAGVLAAVLLTGCSRESPGVTCVEPERAISLLASEVERSQSPAELAVAEFTLHNGSDADATATLAGLGCGCYRLLHEGRELPVHESLVIPAHSDVIVRFDTRPATAPGILDYRAEFDVPSDGGAARLPIHCTVQTLADVALTPDVITHDLDQAVSRYPVVVRRLYRDRTDSGAEPDWGPLPDFLVIDQVHLHAVGVEERTGLWLDEWEAELLIQSDLTDGSTASPIPLTVSFGGAKESMTVVGRATLVLDRSSGIEAPSRLNFGRVPIGQTRARRCLLRAADGIPFRVTGVASESACVACRPPGEAAAVEQWLDLEVTADAASEFAAIVHCRTDHPSTPEITIEVRALVTPAESPTTIDQR